MNGIVNNPTKSIVIPNTTIDQSVEIMNRILASTSYKIRNVDNTMSSAHIWVVESNSKIKGLVDTFMVGTFKFEEINGNLQLTIECGKGLGAISDQWELQDCNMYVTEMMRLALNPNLNFATEEKEMSTWESVGWVAAGVLFILAWIYII